MGSRGSPVKRFTSGRRYVDWGDRRKRKMKRPIEPTDPPFDPAEAITIKAIPLPRLVCWDGLIPADPAEADTLEGIPLPRLVCWDGLIPAVVE